MTQFFASIVFKVWLEIVDNVYTLSYYFRTRRFEWSDEKNKWLKETRGVSFEEIGTALKETKFTKITRHYNTAKYAHQYLLFIEINNFIYLVPFVIGKKALFFKTIFRNERRTKSLWKKTYEKEKI